MGACESDLREELIKYKQLFHACDKLHTFMDKDKILGEIIITLKEIFPRYRFYLHPSHEHDRFNKMTSNCFYAPLKGKHGVKGVIQVVAPITLDFSKIDIEILTLFANSAGSSLENATLALNEGTFILIDINNFKEINDTFGHQFPIGIRREWYL